MVIRGTVDEIIFRNEENGYTVMNFDADGTLVVAVGVFPFISQGERLELTGENKFNAKFGEQFVVSNVDFSKPNDADSIKKYLSSGLFRGVGEITAETIVKKFGAETLDIIEKYPHMLAQISGIGPKRAQEISKCYIENSRIKDTVLFLQKYGITTALALKIYKHYEEDTAIVVQSNPYKLVEDIEGVGFLTADRLAEKLGVDRDSKFRLKAAIYYILQEASGKNGHTYLPRELLIKETVRLTDVDDEPRIAEVLDEDRNGLREVLIDGEQGYCLSLNYLTENSIAAKLINLRNSDSLDLDLDTELRNYEQTNDIVLDVQQRLAIKSAINDGVVIITGGPGTGKTTIIKCITSILGQRGFEVALSAPTGRAAKRMSEATGAEAKTLHRLLGINTKNFDINELDTLDCDVIIVDEISMADIYIFNALLKAVPDGARLVLVGDKDQLPSVACGNILADMIASELFTTVYLDEIYRQAKESMIVVNAHRINNSQMPVTKNSKDFFIDYKSQPSDIKDSIISMASKRIPEFLDISPRDIQVLSPMKKGIAGVEALNERLQQVLNPEGKQVVYKNRIFRVGDKVMQTVNNYTIEWLKNDIFRENGTGVFNGDIGYIIDISNGSLIVEFEDGKLVTYQAGDLEELMTAYCISVHKSQGSEFPVVIIAVTGGSYAILTKNLLYTAVTRAKKMAVIVGDEENIEKMVKNNYITRRFSMLRDFLIKNRAKFQKLWGV
ncbi:MAG: ATP-dependent RecD-like DNA helicase [Clostridia bacterium]|nr:ATP-dependent RecD-like DNA helicase [Clostridia bacterium]